MTSTDAHEVNGQVLHTAIEKLFTAAALPVLTTTDPHVATLLPVVEQIGRKLRNRSRNNHGDLWAVGPFTGELDTIVRMRKIEEAVAVLFADEPCGNSGCAYDPGGQWAIIGALLEVGLVSPSKFVLAEQRTLAFRLLVECQGTKTLPGCIGCLQIAPDDIWTALYAPPTSPRDVLKSHLCGVRSTRSWVKNPPASDPLLAHFARDIPRLLDHLAGRVAPPCSTPIPRTAGSRDH